MTSISPIDLVVSYQVYVGLMKDKLQIRHITEQTGLDRETIRFYEQKGLLPKPERTESGYRQYGPDVLLRIRFIKLAQDVGFTLREVQELFNLGGDKPIVRSDLKKIADQKLAQIDERIRSLKSMKKVLKDLSNRADSFSSKSSCPILSQFKNLEF